MQLKAVQYLNEIFLLRVGRHYLCLTFNCLSIIGHCTTARFFNSSLQAPNHQMTYTSQRNPISYPFYLKTTRRKRALKHHWFEHRNHTRIHSRTSSLVQSQGPLPGVTGSLRLFYFQLQKHEAKGAVVSHLVEKY